MQDENNKAFPQLPQSNKANGTVETTNVAAGSSGTELYSGTFSEEYLSALQGPEAAKVYDKMRRSESQVAMLMAGVKNPIKSANWDVDPAEQTDEYKKHAEFIKHVLFNDLENGWEQFKTEALTFIDFGFSLFEEVHKVVFNHPKFGTYNGLYCLGFRNQKTIDSWNLEKKTGRLISVKQMAYGDVGETALMDGRFLLVFTNQKEGDNYEGISALRPMYGPYFRKNVYHKLIAIGVEKYAIGTPIGTIPKGKENNKAEVDKFESVLQGYSSHNKAWISLAEGWKIEIQKGDFDADKVSSLVSLENTEMVKALVANFLELGMNGSGGAFALSNDLSDFFLGGIQSYANIICDNLNRRTIPNLIKLNFGEQQAYPKIKVTGINDKAGKELAEIVEKLIGSKAIVPDMSLEEYFRKIYALPKKDKQLEPIAGTGGESIQESALNGAQVDSLIAIVQNVAAGQIPRETAIALIKSAFNKSEEQASEILATVGQGFVPKPAVQLSEQGAVNSKKLADNYKQKFKTNTADVKALMQEQLNLIYSGIRADIERKYKAATPANKLSVITEIEPKGVAEYKRKLKQLAGIVALQAEEDARKEVPKAKNVKLAEKIPSIMLDDFSKLPTQVQKALGIQTDLVVQTQVEGIMKATSFQFTSSAGGTDDLNTILFDLDEKVGAVIEGSPSTGMSVDAAAGDLVGVVTNVARNAFFFDDEVAEQIEAFEFVNEDPVSEICSDLNGTIFDKNDPGIDRYAPPLHHNCKSRIVPILVGSGKKVETEMLRPSKASLEKFITLSECKFKRV